jgi:hypothetical protein
MALAWMADERAGAEPDLAMPGLPVMPPCLESSLCDGCGPGAWDRYGERTRKPDDPPDLTLWNFFTAGWDEEWTRRDSEDRAPDLALLHVQTNFMERELRVDSFYQSNVRNKKIDDIDSLDWLIAYGWNRRFQTNVEGIYQWNDARDETACGQVAVAAGKHPRTAAIAVVDVVLKNRGVVQ